MSTCTAELALMCSTVGEDGRDVAAPVPSEAMVLWLQDHNPLLPHPHAVWLYRTHAATLDLMALAGTPPRLFALPHPDDAARLGVVLLAGHQSPIDVFPGWEWCHVVGVDGLESEPPGGAPRWAPWLTAKAWQPRTPTCEHRVSLTVYGWQSNVCAPVVVRCGRLLFLAPTCWPGEPATCGTLGEEGRDVRVPPKSDVTHAYLLGQGLTGEEADLLYPNHAMELDLMAWTNARLRVLYTDCTDDPTLHPHTVIFRRMQATKDGHVLSTLNCVVGLQSRGPWTWAPDVRVVAYVPPDAGACGPADADSLPHTCCVRRRDVWRLTLAAYVNGPRP